MIALFAYSLLMVVVGWKAYQGSNGSATMDTIGCTLALAGAAGVVIVVVLSEVIALGTGLWHLIQPYL